MGKVPTRNRRQKQTPDCDQSASDACPNRDASCLRRAARKRGFSQRTDDWLPSKPADPKPGSALWLSQRDLVDDVPHRQLSQRDPADDLPQQLCQHMALWVRLSE